MASDIVIRFREEVAKLPREDILNMIRVQDVKLIKQINRVEWVFSNKLKHLNWPDGTPITERPLTNEELALVVDPPFTEDPSLTSMGFDIEQQEEIHIYSDPVLWVKHILGIEPYVYQILMLRHPNTRKVFRAGRRLGKTAVLAMMLLHYSFTTREGRCLVMAPMKSHVKLIYEEALKFASNSEIVQSAIHKSLKSPQYEIYFTNGATIKFFTTGLKTGARSDVARGQEAHLIVLDEMDYMGVDDLDALYAMLQRTGADQPDKVMVGASTPTGRRERFWEWNYSDRFKAFWFPSYVNPFWSKELEEEMREAYSDMAYRHEIEADWGEDVEGVYQRKYVDTAFIEPGWKYIPARQSARSVYLMGVDWDKFGAGPNIVVLEACADDYEDERLQGKLRVAHREEIPRDEYVLTKAVHRIVELNSYFNPKHIYIDRGYGDAQHELLLQHGVEYPSTGLKTKVKGISFGGMIEIHDPVNHQPIKKEIKPYMVNNLSDLLQRGEIFFPGEDEELYMQLISYVVIRKSDTGKIVFGSSGTQQDHAHDALILACLAYTENYSDLHKINVARRAISVSNAPFLPLPQQSQSREPKDTEDDEPGRALRRTVVLDKKRRRAGASRRNITRSKF